MQAVRSPAVGVSRIAGSDTTAREISEATGRGKSVVRTFLASPDTYGSAKRQGRPRKLSAQIEEQILDVGWTKKLFAREIIEHLGLHGVSVRHVQRLLLHDKRRQEKHAQTNHLPPSSDESPPPARPSSLMLSMSDVDDDDATDGGLHEVSDSLRLLDDDI
ncbi:hypothetical protein DYB30_003438 [Aphanomyces astaci]|uniref:Tc3 transposase DNA binding domain-containing protein n=1 Tax=Aphanomyces astaci TaxID=112090 RepID=A0A397DJI4_APHAT|nr:hypothetical protein DYB30_003438 [Aphanomyces astaci]